MNRRQFLGRFFQAVISAHNSNSIYGIYHPWRQYEYNMPSSARIKLVYKYGVNSDGTYKQSSLMSISKPGTITAVYNSDGDMIYCSAYWRNGSIYNNFSNTIYLYNLKPGNYTLKVLQCGIGICPGPSGDSMVFTVPEPPDRSEMPNNNYGQIGAPPATEVTYVFDVSGLYFTYDVTIAEVGKYYVDTDLFPCYRASYSAPSYGTCESLYNAKAAEIGWEQKFDSDKYREVILNGAEGGCPLTDEYYYVDAPIYYTYPTMKVTYFEGQSEQDITSINFCGYNPSDVSLYWKVCQQNNLEYDPESQAKYRNSFDVTGAWAEEIPLTSLDGSWAELIPVIYSYDLINENIIDIESWVADCAGSYVANGSHHVKGRVKNLQLSYTSINVASTGSMSVQVYDKDGNATSYNTGELRFKLHWEMHGERRKTSNINSSSTTTYDPELPIPSPSFIIGENLDKAKENFTNVYNEYMKHNEYVSVTESGNFEYFPVDALFGHIPPDKSMGKVINPPGTYAPEAVYYSGDPDIGIKWSDFWRISSDSPYHLEPMLDGYTADLSQYDPNNKCNDSSMWKQIYNGDGMPTKIVFLRQNVLDIDSASIPDHRIG